MRNCQEPLDAVFHALADPTRRAVVGRLMRRPATVTQLAERFEMELPSFMKHLKVLEKSGLMRSRKTGRVRTCHACTEQLRAMECKAVQLDLRPGGGFETLMREGDGDFQPHVEGCFLDIVPERRIVFTTALAEGWRPIDSWLTLTAIMTLKKVGTGTRYTARVMHKTAAESRKHEEMGFYEGWGTTIEQLATLVERVA